MTSPSARRLFAFVSTNPTRWAGSEELWAATAARLASEGHRVLAMKAGLDITHARVAALRVMSCETRSLDLFSGSWARGLHAALARFSPLLDQLQRLVSAGLRLGFARPDLVVVAQGGNLDGENMARLCRRLALPYVLIAQRASERHWPSAEMTDRLRAAYEGAARCFFVSEHNLRLTEEQLGIDLPHATVVRNPFLVPFEQPPSWPGGGEDLRIACVGRLRVVDKGQDLLLRVLGRAEWRERRVTVSFFGEGTHRRTLERMASRLALRSVSFRGHVDDVASIWKDHHALVLPSRAEGLPIALVEAMLSARVAIVTDIAGNGEVVEDGRTGFLAAAPSEKALAAAMERAWERRAEWQAIGERAAARIRTLVPRDPAAVMAVLLGEVVTARHAGARQPLRA